MHQYLPVWIPAQPQPPHRLRGLQLGAAPTSSHRHSSVPLPPLGMGTQRDPREPEWLEGMKVGVGREEDPPTGHTDALGLGWGWPCWVSDLFCDNSLENCRSQNFAWRCHLHLPPVSSVETDLDFGQKMVSPNYHRATQNLQLLLDDAHAFCICDCLPVLFFNANMLYFQGLMGSSN